MNHSRRAFSFLFAALMVVLSHATAGETVRKPLPGVERVLVFSVDGCRPDILLRADTPNIRKLMKRGAFSFWAITTPVAITLPSHVSMMTGVTVARHGIDFNDDAGDKLTTYPKAFTLFEVAHKAGLSTSIVSTKSKFRVIGKNNGSVDYLWTASESSGKDDAAADHAVEIIRDHKPHAMLVHFGQNDKVGHAIGWGTPQQIKQLENADKCVGEVIAAVDEAGLIDSTIVILTSDHGGAGRGHGGPDPRSQFIPWIIAGPGVRTNYELTLFADLKIHTEDTFATACYALGLEPPIGPDRKPIDGKPVTEAFLKNDLIETLAPPISRPATQPKSILTTTPAS